jgi:hypothetical protein
MLTVAACPADEDHASGDQWTFSLVSLSSHQRFRTLHGHAWCHVAVHEHDLGADKILPAALQLALAIAIKDAIKDCQSLETFAALPPA